MDTLSNRNVFQTAWVVGDFDESLRYWTEVLGVGPFFYLDFEADEHLVYRGRPGVLSMRVAWAQAGDTQIELIDPRSPEPNVYRDLVPPGHTRFHHVCFWSDDMDADLAHLGAKGFETAMYSGPRDARFAYVDTSAANGHMVELLERQEGNVALFAKIAEICENWDGEEPLRPLAAAFA